MLWEVFRGKDLSWFDDNQVLADVAEIAEKKAKAVANRIDQEGFIPRDYVVSWRWLALTVVTYRGMALVTTSQLIR